MTKTDVTIRIFFSNFKWHPLTPIIYKFINSVWSFLQKIICAQIISGRCVADEICQLPFFWVGWNTGNECTVHVMASLYDGCNDKAKKKKSKTKKNLLNSFIINCNIEFHIKMLCGVEEYFPLTLNYRFWNRTILISLHVFRKRMLSSHKESLFRRKETSFC